MPALPAAAAAPPSLLHPHVPRAFALLIACLCSFMVVMDGAIVNVALPSIQRELHLDPAQFQWVVDAYLLMLGGLMLLAARASDLYGRKPVLMSGLLVFTLASLAAGKADGAAMLLAARAVQGCGAAALATSTLAVIVAVYPQGRDRARAISLWAASSAIASALGVVAGGVLTAWAGWRWVMFVNVPIGVALMAGVGLSMQAARGGGPRPRLDLAGALSITSAIGVLIYACGRALAGGWGANGVPAMLIGSLVLGALFVAIERRTAQPLVRLGIFALRNVRYGNLVVLCLGAALTSSTLFLSIVLQQVLAYPALDAGLALVPMGLALAVAAIVSRPLMDAGWRRLPFCGAVLGAAGFLWLAALPQAAHYADHVLGPILLIGTGLGLMLMSSAHAALAGVPAADAGLAAGLFNTARQLGAALGVALLSSLAHAFGIAGTSGGSSLAGCHAAFAGMAGLSLVAGLASLRLGSLGDDARARGAAQPARNGA
ncbi:Drug resistance transporter EmrB/QacA subfamily [Janthinobacterium sp. CG23_2]|nr:Drug resistance transporter EmrB/QacA subfamily [Janthinobacterium sp. CG23_2]CUU32457.1 Drug resistance transporter EmrB/QacA subfamily [Janthinobacterium sp. CG23_2]